MKFISINIILNLLIIFQCHGKSINNEFIKIKEAHNYFCPLLFKTELFNLDNRWFSITKTKNIHKYKNKQSNQNLSLIHI